MAADEVSQFRYGMPDGQNMTREDVFDFCETDRAELNEEMYSRMRNSTSMDWSLTQGMFVFGVDSPVNVMLAYKDYTMEGVIENIRFPTLVCDGVSDSKMGDTQAMIFYEKLLSPTTYLLCTNEYCAGEHCQLGASADRFRRNLTGLDVQFSL